MTPAIEQLKALKISHILHEYEHEAKAQSYGLEAAEKLGVEAARVFKTLVVKASNESLAVAIVPVEKQLNFKAMAKAVGAKKVAMAQPNAVSRSSGYVLGGVSPLGQKRLLTSVIDESAEAFNTIFVSGGKRGLEIELSSKDLAQAIKALVTSLT